MVAPGTASRPANERAVEALGFLSASASASAAASAAAGGGGGGGGGGNSRLRSVLVAVGADRWLRLWDVLDGALLAERFTGHRQVGAGGTDRWACGAAVCGRVTMHA